MGMGPSIYGRDAEVFMIIHHPSILYVIRNLSWCVQRAPLSIWPLAPPYPYAEQLGEQCNIRVTVHPSIRSLESGDAEGWAQLCRLIDISHLVMLRI